ncbi:hypothetical protein EYF80_055543 [Liparis tanakae]|uniref:Uncharacterized protein n=1 Tax=Liparis tanakae TaxID=230148 RepID=A0A4Z2EZJ0_9TELE|nr:hypothetical protein EYF80_055543 [Liparis tanakae]
MASLEQLDSFAPATIGVDLEHDPLLHPSPPPQFKNQQGTGSPKRLEAVYEHLDNEIPPPTSQRSLGSFLISVQVQRLRQSGSPASPSERIGVATRYWVRFVFCGGGERAGETPARWSEPLILQMAALRGAR